jgi:hypothetical protein
LVTLFLEKSNLYFHQYHNLQTTSSLLLAAALFEITKEMPLKFCSLGPEKKDTNIMSRDQSNITALCWKDRKVPHTHL